MVVYRLRDNKTGLFSKGGTNGDFNKVGKLWMHKGHLRNHLKQFERIHRRDEKNRLLENINNWEIVEYELNEKSNTDLFSFISDGDAKVEYDLLTRLQKD